MPVSPTPARLHLLPWIAGRFARPHYHRSSVSAQRPSSDHVRTCVLNGHMLCCSKVNEPTLVYFAKGGSEAESNSRQRPVCRRGDSCRRNRVRQRRSYL